MAIDARQPQPEEFDFSYRRGTTYPFTAECLSPEGEPMAWEELPRLEFENGATFYPVMSPDGMVAAFDLDPAGMAGVLGGMDVVLRTDSEELAVGTVTIEGVQQ